MFVRCINGVGIVGREPVTYAFVGCEVTDPTCSGPATVEVVERDVMKGGEDDCV